MILASTRRLAIALFFSWVGLTSVAYLVPQGFPPKEFADQVTRSTARIAVLYWSLAEALILLRNRELARWAWTIGAGAFLIHVITAFDQVHGWSHARAFDHVEAESGFGPGIFVSYAFSLLWCLDAVWWLIYQRSYETRPRCQYYIIHGSMAFVVFNGTVVYETGFIRWAGLCSFLVLGCLLAWSVFTPRSPIPIHGRE